MMKETKNESRGIVSWPQDERPRERLLSRGPQALTDAELLAILVRVGLPVRYQLNFLTPKDFNKYFIQMRKGELAGFRSELDIALQAVAESGAK